MLEERYNAWRNERGQEHSVGSDSDEGLAVTPNTEKAARTLASFRDLPSIPAPATAAVQSLCPSGRPPEEEGGPGTKISYYFR